METEETAEMLTIVEPGSGSNFYIERRFHKRFRFGCEAEDDVLAIVAADQEDLKPYFRGRKVVKCSDLEDGLTGNFVFAILDTPGREERDFARLCDTFPARNVYWLEKCGRSFVARREKIVTLSEDDLVGRPDKVKIVVGDPGSGKTTLLKRLLDRVRTCDADLGIGILIDLGTMDNELEALLVAENKNFTVGESGSLDIGAAHALFGLSGPGGDRHLFVDGFDEIDPKHQAIVVAALKLLGEAKVKIWIAARPHSRPRLEADLGVASFSLVAFSSDEERSFLRRHWLSLVNVDASSAAVDDFVEEYLGVVSALRADVAHRFVASPLLIKLVVEVHQDDFGSSAVRKPRVLTELLDAFVRKQFEALQRTRGHDFSDPYQQIGMGDAFREFRRRLTRLAVRQLRLGELASLVGDEEECTTKLHRSVAEHLVARLLATCLDNGSRQTAVAFLHQRYFDGGLATIRVLLDRYLAQGSPVHEAALDDDLQRLVAILERDVGAMVQGDALGRTALHLTASYCGAGLRRLEDVAVGCKSTLHLMCRSWQQIQIRDDLGFNAFSYAVGSLDPGIVAFQEMARMLKGSGEAPCGIASNAMGMLRHVERQWAESRSNFFGYEDLQDLLEGFFGSSEFARFLTINAGHRDKMTAALRMASPKAIADAMAEDGFRVLKHILASGFFDGLLTDRSISLIGLRDRQSEIVLLDDFRAWFRAAVNDCRLAVLTGVMGFLDLDSMRGLWEMPETSHLQLFHKAVERMECGLVAHLAIVFQNRIRELTSGSGLVACLQRTFNAGKTSEFLEVVRVLSDESKEEVLKAIDYIKAFEDALASKDATLLDQLSGLFYSDAKLFEMKTKVGVQYVLEYFGSCLQTRDYGMAVPLLRYVGTEEHHRVWDVLGQRSKFHDLCAEHVSFMSGLFKNRIKPSDLHLMLEFLHNYPVVRVQGLQWSVWEHAYCMFYSMEIQKSFPPDIHKCLGEDYVHWMLTNKQNLAAVRHLFHLATDDQKCEICLANDQEFLKFALTNYPQEITDQRCGNGRYLKGIPEQALDTEEYSSWFLGATGQRKYDDLLKLTTFSSMNSQLRLWKKIDYKTLFRDAFQDKEYDFVLNLLKIFRNVPEEDLLTLVNADEHLKSIPKENTDKLADILGYMSTERATKVLMGMNFVHQFQNAVKEKSPLTLSKRFRTYKDFSMMVSAMKASVEVGNYIEYFEHFLTTKDGEALWALLQYISNEEKKVAKKVSKYSTSIANAVGLEIALNHASEKYLQQMLESLKEYCSALTQGYDLSIWQHMLILLGCISYNKPGQFPCHVKQHFNF